MRVPDGLGDELELGGEVPEVPDVPVVEVVEVVELVEVVAALATSAPPTTRPEVSAPAASTLLRRICMGSLSFVRSQTHSGW
ncbi:MAG TPA: hypothetical protein VHD39_03635 [Acidimicrobiales bacterium]|nr:hypothetical protein [Acidimicrobiales bacterium]